MIAQICPPLIQRFFDSNGAPLSGGQLFSYIAGSTTPLATYTDETGVTPNANPVILDATGSAEVWLGNSYYKFVLEDALGNLIFSVDNVAPPSLSANTNIPVGTIFDSTFTIANNQSSAANVAGLAFALANNSAAVVNYGVTRITTGTGATTISCLGQLFITYDTVNGWRIMNGPEGPDASGVTFSITGTGQVQYTSTNISGTASVSRLKFNASVLGV